MVEHLSKWIELVALSQNSLKFTTMAFYDHVLAHFGAKVLLDQGYEFLNAFEDFCIKALIDCCKTSRDHLKTNNLAKEWSKQLNVVYGSMDYFEAIIKIGILCCYGLSFQ